MSPESSRRRLRHQHAMIVHQPITDPHRRVPAISTAEALSRERIVPREKIDAFARARIGTPRTVELRVAANRDRPEAERLQDLAQHTVRQRGQIYDEMATRRADYLPPAARKDH